jgi:hypothetical protein
LLFVDVLSVCSFDTAVQYLIFQFVSNAFTFIASVQGTEPLSLIGHTPRLLVGPSLSFINKLSGVEIRVHVFAEFN